MPMDDNHLNRSYHCLRLSSISGVVYIITVKEGNQGDVASGADVIIKL